MTNRKRIISTAPKIAMIGGGTGSFTLLSELKKFTPHISALVNMSDDGGSTGKLRDELGVLPPGDIRQCLVALSDLPHVRDLFNYRFGEGAFEGHSLGNIILSGLELQYKDFNEAIKVASLILQITGQVLPITLHKHTLVLHDDKKIIRGEHEIGNSNIYSKDAYIELEPLANINPLAEKAILEADLVVIAPGNLYASLLPALAVNGVAKAIKKSQAKIIVVSNLVTKPGQTDHWHIVDYVKTLEKYIGKGEVDIVLYNTDNPSKDLLKKYANKDEYPVDHSPERFSEISALPIGAAMLGKSIGLQPENDRAIQRTLIRHDASSASRQLMRIYYD